MRSKTCSKCGGRMSEGFLLDHTYGSQKDIHWVEGAPEKSIWTGVKTKGRQQLPVSSYRCERCGLLENYAESR